MFRLTKWYLDCVSDAGDVVIAHCAVGKRGMLPLGYASLLVSPHNGNATERRSMRRPASPQRTDGSLDWGCERLGISGRSHSGENRKHLSWAGLRLYQWAAIVSFALGIGATTLPAVSGPGLDPLFEWQRVVVALGFGVLCGFALGVDFPALNTRFSRLASA